jgi:hemerythrin-like domain-containing protein
MADAIEILTDEHKLIETMLGSLEAFAERLGDEPESDRATVREYTDFFRKFVDECHHGKEEDYLFLRMSAYGFSNEAGPVSAMLSEQGEGREHLNALADIGQGTGPLTARERTLVKGHALGYISRIESHMKREDDILFPVARHALPPFVLEELTVEFEKFDGNAVNRPIRENLLRIARELVAKYPPNTAGKNRS